MSVLFDKKCFAIYLVCLVFSAPLFADKNNTLLEVLIKTQSSDPDYNMALERGGERSMLCGYCHGKDGNSVKNYIPNLAQQNPEYLLNQFTYFASGERKSYVMEQIAKGLSNQEMVDLSLFFAAQSLAPNEHAIASEIGQDKYQSFCFACHGDKGEGNKDLPRLAGQKEAFLVKTLTTFKQGKAARSNSPMVRIMSVIDASDIAPLAAYISSMK